MTSHVCTEESRETELFEGNGIGKNLRSVIYVEETDTPQMSESFFTAEDRNEEETKAFSPTNPEESNFENRCKFLIRYWKRKMICFFVTIFFLMLLLTGLIVWSIIEIAKMKEHKSVMLYRPTVEYLENTGREETIKWRLIEEHSQNPFMQINSTHIHVNEDGFFHISCSLLMQTNSQNINVITLLIFYANEEKSVYTKKTLPKNFSRFSLQYSIVLHLQKGAYFYMQVIPSKYLLKDPDGSYLSITHV